jgi:regulatory protein
MFKAKKKNAFEKIVEIISYRDHSAKELRTKLTLKKFSEEEIEGGMGLAEEYNLIIEPEKLAENLCGQLHRKNKGILYINQYLKSKGLPAVAADWDKELEKARDLAQKRFSKNPPYTIEEKQDIYRYLTNRGYADQTINRVINEKC